MRERVLDAGVVRINLAEGPPAGPPLLLLHGLANRWQTFEPLLPALTVGWQVIAPDFRGHGGSDRADQYRLREYADDMLGVLQDLPAPAVIFGHSSGAAVALFLAAEAPDRVRAAIVADWIYPDSLRDDGVRDLFAAYRTLAGSGLPMDELAQALATVPIGAPDGSMRRVGDVPWMDGAALRAYAETLSKVDPGVFSAAIDGRLADGYDPDALLPRVSCPVLILQGNPARGGLLTCCEVTRALALLRDGRSVMVEEVGHDMHQEAAEPVLRAVMPFLESL